MTLEVPRSNSVNLMEMVVGRLEAPTWGVMCQQASGVPLKLKVPVSMVNVVHWSFPVYHVSTCSKMNGW